MKQSIEKNYYLIIHGHFYQPPRENPWTERIEKQDSASPYHDWNQRIAAECYTPNSVSRILNASRQVSDIVNNYCQISFNFGPTLLSWLEAEEPETYHRILEADQISQEKFSGHGNALAQAYNHIILPLANRRDKITQVRWGLADFRYRFGREPEALWLPETAINYPTLAVLIEHGLKFIILAPTQAQRIRSLGGSDKDWINVSMGDINISRTYRCFLKDENNIKREDRYIDVFFYDGPLSRGVAFEHLLRNAETLADKIQKAFRYYSEESLQNILVSIATDGESFGHHEAFGDMGLAYLLQVEAPRRDFKITNYGEFLEKNPPQYEVEINDGPNGEGTSWSCVHGVGRWYRDCGCSTGGLSNWNQKWRWHLRTALDLLRDELAVLFQEKGKSYLKDVWAARDDYIQVILNRSPKTIQQFFEVHGSKPLSHEEKTRALELLELQRQALLMYTSCGWFFADLSGLETVQILKYAARAIEIAETFGAKDLEVKFLSELKKAKSNILKYRDGELIYQKLVKPSRISFPHLVNHYAISSLFKPLEAQSQIYHYTVYQLDYHKETVDKTVLLVGRVRLRSGITYQEQEYAFALIYQGKPEFKCLVREISDDWNYEEKKVKSIELLFHKGYHLEQALTDLWDSEPFTLRDMILEEREELLTLLLQDKMAELDKVCGRMYYENQEFITAIAASGLPVPLELKILAEHTLSLELLAQVENLKTPADEKSCKKAIEIVEKARELGFQLNKDRVQSLFQQRIEQKVAALVKKMTPALCEEILQLLEIAEKLEVPIRENKIQNCLFQILKNRLPPLIDEIINIGNLYSQYELVSCLLRLSYKLNFDISPYKEKLKPLEIKLSQDPQFWP